MTWSYLVADAQPDELREEAAAELGFDELLVGAAQRALVDALADNTTRELVVLQLQLRPALRTGVVLREHRTDTICHSGLELYCGSTELTASITQGLVVLRERTANTRNY